MNTASDFLDKASTLLRERAKEYDKQGGERSIPKTVLLFNTITGRDLTPKEGWLFMSLLKKVRLWSNPKRFHRDSAEDNIAYDALEAEEWELEFSDERPTAPNSREAMPDTTGTIENGTQSPDLGSVITHADEAEG